MIGVLGVLQIDLNARVLAVLLILEVVVVALFDFAILADPGPEGITGVGFDPGVAFGTAVGATLTFCVASFVGFESAAIYSRGGQGPQAHGRAGDVHRDRPDRRVLRALELARGHRGGPEHDRRPGRARRRGGFTHAGRRAPDPTTVLFITGADRLGAFWGDSASLLFATSLFAALLSFHNAVARYAFALGRERRAAARRSAASATAPARRTSPRSRRPCWR